MENKKRCVALIKVFAASLALVFVVGVFRDKEDKKDSIATDDGYYIYDFAMGTSISCQIYGDKDVAKAAVEKINAEIKRLDEKVISWRAPFSELAGINAGYASGGDIYVSDELALILGKSYELCKASDGALDITIRPLLNLWGIENAGEDFRVPDDSSIKNILDTLGYDRLKLKDNKLLIEGENIILDLGAVGKGYALNAARNVLMKEQQLDGAVISVGGSILVYGSKSDNTAWKIGVRNPKGNIDDMLGYIELKKAANVCVSTSGDYEKYVEKDGVRYHHILDIGTGYPADTGLSSVTVLCEDGLISDGLSTSCFVLGYERSKSLLDTYNANAVFIDKDNNVKVYGDLKFCEQHEDNN